ncbi:hypothetical protein SETIT_7G239600v2 [Setaria italica]|uniref:Uncharacterized protein n=1 Tax=Setaria italica TaxID=4555 RepID=A0A368RZC1_SETIT|nr:hypothetical protein SETIT_7G239600v2 [Setaria italica]
MARGRNAARHVLPHPLCCCMHPRTRLRPATAIVNAQPGGERGGRADTRRVLGLGRTESPACRHGDSGSRSHHTQPRTSPRPDRTVNRPCDGRELKDSAAASRAAAGGSSGEGKATGLPPIPQLPPVSPVLPLPPVVPGLPPARKSDSKSP